jgi:hypothetical protein
MRKLTSGAAVLLGSFWLTLEILDYWTAPDDPDADLIAVTEATYGMNCRGGVARSGQPNEVKAGNATAAVAESCLGTSKTCTFVVDVNRIGDPAPDCGKDLSIAWRCGAQPTVHRIYVAAEAHGQRISLRCPWER